ncbi:hypothetical protein [Ruegeria sp. SCP11]|uniref:hypothetical protein n=1 Tax=Ruegeria sp. SCP11 TaxID=3141378 RepID=UPI00333DE2AB
MKEPEKLRRNCREGNAQLQQTRRALPFVLAVFSNSMNASTTPAEGTLHRGHGIVSCDPTLIGQLRFNVSSPADLSVLASTAGVVIFLFSPAVRNLLVRENSNALSLGFCGGLITLLAIEDLFLIHENALVNESFFFLTYILIVAIGCGLFWKQFNRHPTGIAIAAMPIFAVSLVVHRLKSSAHTSIEDFRKPIEDSSKFTGAVCSLVLLCKTSAAAKLERVPL